MIAYRSALHPDSLWTPEAAASFVARYDLDVSEAIARLRERLEAAYPQGWIFVHRYTPETICRYRCTRRETEGQTMGYVEVRTRTGECYSGTVSVRWDDGTVVISENPALPS